MTTFLENLTPLVDRAAIATTHKWPSYVSKDDVSQEIWIWALSRQKSIEKAFLTEDWEAKVYSTMLRAASEAASKEDRETNGYSKDDTYVYSAAVIETLLDSAFTYEDWQSFATFGDGQPRAKGQVNETGDYVAMMSDVKSALAEIKKEYREVLYYRHGEHETFEEAGLTLGITKDGAKKRHTAAINALRGKLGRVELSDLQSGHGERRGAIGNGEARAITDRQYEG